MDVLETTKFQSKMEHTNSDVEEYFASVKETSLNISDEKIKVTKLQDDLLENSNDSFSSENSSVYASPMANVEDTDTGMEAEAEVANERLNETNIKPFGHEKPFNPNQGKILAAMLKEVDKNYETVINSENLTSPHPEQNCEEYRNAKNENSLATCPTELVHKDKSRNSDKQPMMECSNEMPVLKENKISLNAKSKIELKESVAISGSSGSLVISTGTSTATNSLANLSTTATGLTDSATISISTANSVTNLTSIADSVTILSGTPNSTSITDSATIQTGYSKSSNASCSLEDSATTSTSLTDSSTTLHESASTSTSNSTDKDLNLKNAETCKVPPTSTKPAIVITKDTHTGIIPLTGVKTTTVCPTSHPSGPQNRKRSKEVFLVKSLQAQEKPSVTTAKAKIKPVFGLEDINRRNKSNDKSFPIIYIGAPNILDMQAYRKQVKAEEDAAAATQTKKFDITTYLDDETGQIKTVPKLEPSEDLSPKLNVFSEALKTIASVTVATKSTSSTSSVPLKLVATSKSVDLPLKDTFTIKKTMAGFLNEDDPIDRVSKPVVVTIPTSKLPVWDDSVSPSMIYTSPFDPKPLSKAINNPKPINLNKSASTATIITSPKISAISVKCSKVSPTVVKSSVPVVWPLSSSADNRPFKLIVKKTTSLQHDIKTLIPAVSVSTKVLTTAASSSIKVVKPDTNQIYKYKWSKPLNKTDGIQVLKPNLPIISTRPSKPASDSFVPIKVASITQIKTESPVTPVPASPKPAIVPVPTPTPLHKKIDQLVKSKERKFNRKGMLIKFEDGVKMWVDNIRNVTYDDDEPIKSWRVKPGTKVAAKYSDGLFYDAEVVASYDGTATTAEYDKKETTEKQQESKESTNPPPPPKRVRNTILNRRPQTQVSQTQKNPGKPAANLTNKPSPTPTKEEPLDEVIPKRRTPSVKFHKRNLKRKTTPPESATSETEEQPPPKVPRVHIKKLAEKYTVSCESDVSDESERADVSTTSTSSSKVAKPTRETGDGTTKIYKTKCPSCHLVFTAVNDYNRHHKSVCHAEGIEICVHAGSDLSMTDAVEVDETGDPPPLLETENKKREDAENNCEEFVPRSPGGKRLFRRGTRIMHRWQTPKGGSRWYSGKILRLLPSKGAKAEYEVEYTDDAGPYAVTLGDDYPHDIRVITR